MDKKRFPRYAISRKLSTALYQEMQGYASPFDFIDDNAPVFAQLEQGYQDDMAKALEIKPYYCDAAIAVYCLPNAVWTKRVNGVFGNTLANQHPERAHAVVTYTVEGDYQVSVRAPLNNKCHADTLCRLFATGGGRSAAAGINHLPKAELNHFIEKFQEQYR